MDLVSQLAVKICCFQYVLSMCAQSLHRFDKMQSNSITTCSDRIVTALHLHLCELFCNPVVVCHHSFIIVSRCEIVFGLFSPWSVLFSFWFFFSFTKYHLSPWLLLVRRCVELQLCIPMVVNSKSADMFQPPESHPHHLKVYCTCHEHAPVHLQPLLLQQWHEGEAVARELRIQRRGVQTSKDPQQKTNYAGCIHWEYQIKNVAKNK